MYNLKVCHVCGRTMQYLDNNLNDLTYLICPKCQKADKSELYVTIEQRIGQGYERYSRGVECTVDNLIRKSDDDETY